MSVTIQLGLGAFRSFKRLSYTPWHALAEFVDNSTQSYFDHRRELDDVFKDGGTGLAVTIDYDSDRHSSLSIMDNAMGMSEQELNRALIVGEPPPKPTGRSRYGFGLKTAASWFGDRWTVETKRLGSRLGYRVTVDVESVASGNAVLPLEEIRDVDRREHFTRINITHLNRPLHARTRGKIKEFLRSMYRQDLQAGLLTLVWMNEALKWQDDFVFARNAEGTQLRHDFRFRVGNRGVQGWAGVLAKGSRAKAGFSVLHSGRVVEGWPDAWRPQEIYGQFQGSNDLVNQRLVGEIRLDAFGVSQTKDDILWFGDEEQEVELRLKDAVSDLIGAANALRRPTPVLPSPDDVRVASQHVQDALASGSISKSFAHLRIPPRKELNRRRAASLSWARQQQPDVVAAVDGLAVSGYLGSNLQPSDQYMTVGSAKPGQLEVIINLNHPHVRGMNADVLIDHLEHCTYLALAEWKASNATSNEQGDVVRFLLDALLRVRVGER